MNQYEIRLKLVVCTYYLQFHVFVIMLYSFCYLKQNLNLNFFFKIKKKKQEIKILTNSTPIVERWVSLNPLP